MSGLNLTQGLEYQGHSLNDVDNGSEAIGGDDVTVSGSSTVRGSSSIFAGGQSRPHDDLKQMLESSKDSLKLDAMKRLVAMIAKGRSSDSAARDLFPSVVKNVVTKNVELKKLVYLYLTRYAEQEQDLALLSISSFQRSLKDPNPLIRGSALRVLSSIRVPMIAPIMLVAIKDCANDMSPYVRKTAAHAIPKLYSLDSELKDDIISIIERLLNDRTSLVLGSAVAAFEEVCPDRIDLIHANFRKFASLMADFDEWGQIILINMLIRYGRTQFVDPSASDGHIGDSDHRMLLRNSKPLLQSRNAAVVMAVVQLHLTLGPNPETNTVIVKPLIRLLHSHREIQALVLANIVTMTTAAGSSKYNQEDVSGRQTGLRNLFEPYLKSFFVKSRDSTQVKVLKLEILTNLSTSSNIALILREFQAYIENYQEGEDGMVFVGSTIQAIGRCATRIKEVAPICLNGLITLLSNRNEAIVAQSIIVIRTQIINKEREDVEENLAGGSVESNTSVNSTKADSIVSLIVKQVTKLLDKITTPTARATIIWILAEFCSKNSKAYQVAPDVLRNLAKTFANESDLVKLQTMSLAAKLFVASHPNIEVPDGFERVELDRERLKLLVNYIFSLAKYDVNYDVRDRGRFLKQLLNETETKEDGTGLDLAKHVLLAPKATMSRNADSNNVPGGQFSANYRVGTLSHFVGRRVNGYQELPDFPEVAPDASVREQVVEVSSSPAAPAFELIGPRTTTSNGQSSKAKPPKQKKKPDKFYSSSEEDEEESDDNDEEDSDEDEEASDEDEESGEDEETDEEESSEEDSEESSDEESEESDNKLKVAPSKAVLKNKAPSPVPPVVTKKTPPAPPAAKSSSKPSSKSSSKASSKPSVDLLLLDFDGGSSGDVQQGLPPPSMYTSIVTPMTETSTTVDPNKKFRIVEYSEVVPTVTYDLANLSSKKVNLIYRYPRIRENCHTLVELIARSDHEEEVTVRIASEAPDGVVVFKGRRDEDTKEIVVELSPGEIKLITLAIDFKESSSQGVELLIDNGQRAKIVAPVGEIVVPVRFYDLNVFNEQQSKLRGMNEIIETIKLSGEDVDVDRDRLTKVVLKTANLGSNVFPAPIKEVNEEEDGEGDNGVDGHELCVARYAGATLKTNCLVLVEANWIKEAGVTTIKLRVNCEQMMFGSTMAKTLKEALSKGDF